VRTIEIWDDLDARAGRKVPAADTIQFCYGGKWYELDLSADHVIEFGKEMARWTEAAHKPDAPVPDRPAGIKPAPGGQRRAYWLALRTWADQQRLRNKKDPSQPAYMTTTGKMYYPVWLVEQYDAWLADQEEAA